MYLRNSFHDVEMPKYTWKSIRLFKVWGIMNDSPCKVYNPKIGPVVLLTDNSIVQRQTRATLSKVEVNM